MLQKVEWNSDLEIGINVIDAQHKRIVDYINQLVDFDGNASHQQLSELIDSLVDYTYSHFAFEEALMEEAGYEYLNVHQRTHEAFTARVTELHQRFKADDDVSHDIGELLQTWLINHIMEDDQSYAPLVKQQLPVIENKDSGGWLSSTLGRFFK